MMTASDDRRMNGSDVEMTAGVPTPAVVGGEDPISLRHIGNEEEEDCCDNDDQQHHSLPERLVPVNGYAEVMSCEEEGSPPPSSPSGFSHRTEARRGFVSLLAVCAVVAVASVLLASRKAGGRSWDGSGNDDGFAALPPSDATLRRFAFGSCSEQTMPLPYWDTVASLRPDVTILGGDNVYGDCDDDDVDCMALRRAYADLAAHPSFVGARRALPMVATLDDHDYGRGDAHADNPHRDVAKEVFLDFFDVPPDDERRLREGDGVYTLYEWGPFGQRVQVVLLDTRYARSAFLATDKEESPYRPYDADDDSKRMLSEDQWSWLESTLSRPADVRLIVSSVQVLANGHGFECWRMIPRERERLYQLLRSVEGRTILLSGDRHVGGFYQHETDDLYEVTSSSWTHTIPLGIYTACSTASECDEADDRRLGDFVRENHFGTFDLDWEKREMTVSLRRAEGNAYSGGWNGGGAGEPLQSRTFSIPPL